MKSSSPVVSLAGETQLIDLPDLSAGGVGGSTLLSANSALLDSIAVSMTVVVGQAQTTLGQLMRLKETDVLTIDRKVDVPVDIVVNGNVVGRGQLVAVGEQFGVRVTEVAVASKA